MNYCLFIRGNFNKNLPLFFCLIFSFLEIPAYAQQNKATKLVLNAMDKIFSQTQVDAAREIYINECSLCHGKDLKGSEGGSSLIGDRFIEKWKNKNLVELYTYTQKYMPKTKPNSLDATTCTNLIAYILKANGYPSGTESLSFKQNKISYKIGENPPNRVSMAFQAPQVESKTKTIEADWRQHRGDLGSANYSSLEQINADNVNQMKIAWRWKSDNFGPSPEYYFKVTPLMANGILYTTAGLNRSVVAVNAENGETLWTYRLDESDRKQYVPRQNSGRGVAYWTDTIHGKDRIVYISPGFQMVALDAKTGLPIEEFGEKGVVDLKKGLSSTHIDPNTSTIGSTSPPIIVNDIIIMGSTFPVGLAPSSKSQVRGDIMAYDIRTGKKIWNFNTIPQAGEYGNETWKADSWKYTGNAGAWSPLTADAELGYVYIPLEAATGDFYGGHRPGDNLFSQSLVCLDVKTGKRVWHYQLVHHDIWDYDLPAPPILTDITVDGKNIKAVVQVTKQAFAFVFDRITGKPVWPIEEKAVPQSTVPGEQSSPTQPFPTKPLPFDRQGYSEDILVDFTPQIKQEAIKIAAKYHKGPLFTPINIYNPPKELGTLMIPDAVGGANWQGGVFDPIEKILYVSSSTVLRPMSIEATNNPDMAYAAYLGSSKIGPFGLPLVKPPYGRITAIDMNKGEHLWMIANADSPKWIKENPALKGLKIPRTGTPERVGMLVTKSLLFAGEGSGLYGSDGGGGNIFRAIDKKTGKILAEIPLPSNQTGMPMTYSINGKQYIVLAVGAVGHPGELIALSL